MKLIDKFIIEGMAFIMLFVVYMIWSDKPIIYKYFWRSYFYVLLYAIPFVFSITILPMSDNLFKTMLIWSMVIFWGEFIIYNFLAINKDYHDFIEYCTSKVFGIVFSLSIVVMIFISFIVKSLK
jgi:hypothetical protein